MQSANKFENVDEYIKSFAPENQEILNKIRQVIIKSAPDARELISYGMPFYEFGGAGVKGRLIYFAAFKKHISLFIAPRNSEIIPKEMNEYHVSKATYQFPLDSPFPFEVPEKTLTILVNERK
jgi:uncharacterized protein YdhG (YjbR/CyaY superfamily)